MRFRYFRFAAAAAALLLAAFTPGAWAESTQAKQPAPKSAPAAEEKLAPVLAPEQFFGAAAMGYAAAKAVPHICHKLFCYCGCDITDSHSNLLDCFTSYHGADCHICQEEALLALKMNRDEQPIATIQKVIDETYSSKYPFKEDSPAYKKYKATRLWTAGGLAPASVGPKPDASKDPACCAGK
ncbi:MAG TPA: CYCXC family (seleno)protein [Candidatus Obscuribacterales bacterium]